MTRKSSPDLTTAELWQTHPNAFKMRTPFNPEFLFEFRKRIPVRERKWLPDEKVWIINFNYISDVGRLCGGFFDVVEAKLMQAPPQPPPVQAKESPFETLLRLAPPEAVKTLWREALKKNHPDSGGTHEQLLTLQRVYTEVTILLGIF